MTTFRSRLVLIIALLACLGATAGCAPMMREQPRYEPLEASAFFADGASARSQVADTVARGQLQLDEHLNTGRVNGQFAASFPFTMTMASRVHSCASTGQVSTHATHNA